MVHLASTLMRGVASAQPVGMIQEDAMEGNNSLIICPSAEVDPLGLGAATTPMPVALRGWQRPSVEEQRRRALPVLEKARRLLVLDGWCQREMRDARGRWSLYGAIAEAGEARIEAEYARRALRDVLWRNDLPEWNDSPEREKREVLRAIDRALKMCRPHKGGWRVTK